jgi:hypothetical protein
MKKLLSLWRQIIAPFSYPYRCVLADPTCDVGSRRPAINLFGIGTTRIYVPDGAKDLPSFNRPARWSGRTTVDAWVINILAGIFIPMLAVRLGNFQK